MRAHAGAGGNRRALRYHSRRMRAAIIAVGSELLSIDRLDTNSLRLASELERCGVELVEKCVLPDDPDAIAASLSRLLEEVGLVLVTGGLGPTADDVTRQAAAAALGLPLELDRAVLAQIEARFASYGLPMPEVNRRQAEVVRGAEVIDNPRGTAPGLLVETAGRALFLFPGVPVELEGMIASRLVPWLADRTVEGAARERTVLKVALLPESEVEERIAPAYEEFGREAISVLARPGEILVRATAGGPAAERRARLERMGARLAELLGRAVFARDEAPTLESVVLDLARARGATLATAESCTGGLLGARLTSVPGSSASYLGGVVSYADAAKRELLGVSQELLDRHGAVSEAVARGMAAGVAERLDADFGIGITGVAGPDGGTEGKPVGTVHLAWTGPDGWSEYRKVRLPGDRQAVRERSTQVALEVLRRRLSR